MAFGAGARIGIQPSLTIHAKVRWMRINPGMAGNAVVLGVAAGAIDDISPSHDPVVIRRTRIYKAGRMKRHARRRPSIWTRGDLSADMTGRAKVLGRMAGRAIGLLHTGVDGMNRHKIGRMHRVDRAYLRGMTARALRLLMT